MSKREPNKTKRQRKKVDLADRYQEIGIGAVAAALRWQTKDFLLLDEKRAYYRFLRHLLSEKLQASYMEDQARPLPPRMVDLLKTLEHCKPPETH